MSKQIKIASVKLGENYRKEIDEKSIDELIESIKSVGLLQPITVREIKNDEFILIAGFRRFRAHVKMKAETIEATILTIDEEQARTASLIENIQRENPHAMDEGEAFYEMSTNKTPEQIAKQLGVSVNYVVKRIQLVQLIDPVKKMFYQNKISLNIAIEFAKLQPKQQKEIFEEYSQPEGKTKIFDKSLREFKRYVENNFVTNLSKALFDKSDAKLFEKAGSCLDCKKRTGANKNLFDDIDPKEDICLDSSCFITKNKNFVVAMFNEAKKEHKNLVFATSKYYIGNDDLMSSIGDDKIKKNVNIENLKTKPTEHCQPVMVLDAGGKFGKVLFLDLTETNTKKKAEDMKPAEIVQNVKARLKRGEQLDRQKIHDLVKEKIEQHPIYSAKEKFSTKERSTVFEKTLVDFFIAKNADYSISDKVQKLAGFRVDIETFERFMKLPINIREQINIVVMFNNLKKYSVEQDYSKNFHLTILALANRLGIKTKEIIDAQNEVAAKRQERANNQINKIKSSEKQEAKKPTAKKTVKK